MQRAPVPCNTGHSLVVAGALERRHGVHGHQCGLRCAWEVRAARSRPARCGDGRRRAAAHGCRCVHVARCIPFPLTLASSHLGARRRAPARTWPVFCQAWSSSLSQTPCPFWTRVIASKSSSCASVALKLSQLESSSSPVEYPIDRAGAAPAVIRARAGKRSASRFGLAACLSTGSRCYLLRVPTVAAPLGSRGVTACLAAVRSGAGFCCGL